jgi:hypothetical protein
MDTHTGKEEKSGNFITAIIRLINNIIEFFANRQKLKEDERKRTEVEQAKTELKKALAEGRVTDAAYWRKKLLLLTGSLCLAFVMNFISGCNTPQPQTLIIGERINKVKPGEVIIVPKLVPPAQQWYLVDDTGLAQWLNIDTPTTKSPHPSRTPHASRIANEQRAERESGKGPQGP